MRPWVLLGAALAAAPTRALAQEFADRGVFVIERGSAETGRVEFALRHTAGKGGLLLVALTRTPAHDLDVALELSRDSIPVSFQQTETVSGRVVRRVSATVSGRRFSARASSTESEVVRELPVSPPLFILGEEDYAAFAFLPRPASGTTRTVTVVRTADLTSSAALVDGGVTDSVRIRGRALPCRRFALHFPSGEERRFWISPEGRLLKVEIPGAGIQATRTEPPSP
ncbi:MAG: hypothetical protein ACHQU1_00875 [Gemmatimonadales bacterium]